MPETLPTVTSSIMTGEFCGRVATSARSTVIEYEPGPWPAVPGSATEFNPPNWQPASSALPAANALPRNQIRLIAQPLARPARATGAPVLVQDPAAGRMDSAPRRAHQELPRWSMPAEPSAPAGQPDWADARRAPVSSAGPEWASATWPASPGCRIGSGPCTW